MPQWRSVELEKLIGGPLTAEGLSESNLSRLVENQVREGEQLDFKSGRYSPTRGPRGEWSSEQEFAKDVAAFANHRGGVLLLGVEESDGVATGLSAITEVTFSQEEQRLSAVIATWVVPSVEIMLISVLADGGGFYLAVVVPPSVQAPHAVLGNPGDKKRPLRFPVRHGADTAWMTESEISDRYRRRLEGRARAEARIEGVLNSGFAALRRANSMWFYQAIIPEIDLGGRLSRREGEEIQRWLDDEFSSWSPIGEVLFSAMDRGIPAPGRMVFTEYPRRDEDEAGDPRNHYVELYVDGSAFVAVQIRDIDAENNVYRVNDARLVDFSIVLTNLCSMWASGRVGAWGTAEVISGFYGRPSPSGFDRSIELVDSLIPEHAKRFARTRRLDKPTRFSTVADLSATESMQDRLVVAYNALIGPFQAFGLPEPSQLTRDGSLVPREFMRADRKVREWAQNYDVSCNNGMY